jgi:gamma-tubulin complex component 3
MSVRRAPARSRRVDDALSQLIDSILPPLSLSALGDDYSADEEDALAAAEERRHRDRLDRAWRILDSVDAGNGANPSAAENINNASDLIKRKLLRENASPDKAVRFSNLYSRLLTQPVLGQKWAILYLLYRLSESSGEEDERMDDGDRSRSPLMEEGSLDNLLFKGSRGIRPGMKMVEDVDEGPAISSSVSQRGGRPERKSSLRMPAEKLRRQTLPEEGKESPLRRSRAESTAKDTVVPEKHASSQPDETGQRTMKPSESALLRDLPFVLQGLSSTNVEFSSSSVLKLPTTLPIPMISLLHTLAEPCLLYKGLSAFVDSSEGGLVSQALRAAIGNELRSYLSLVATLEGEIRRALTAAADETDPKSVVKGAVTLKRCVVWTREATMALRLMSVMVEEARRKFSSPFRYGNIRSSILTLD